MIYYNIHLQIAAIVQLAGCEASRGIGGRKHDRVRSNSMQVVRSLKTWWPRPPFWAGGPMGFVFALVLVVVTTAAIGVATRFVDLGHVGAIYLIPVLISAMRWGLAPALLAATTSVA